MADDLKVKSLFQQEGIDLEWLEENFYGVSPYNNRSFDFLVSVWGQDFWELSDKQKDWVDKILEDVTEFKIENRL